VININLENRWFNSEWQTDEYKKNKAISFELWDSFLTTPPTNILDIGCGLAFESEMFQTKYNSNLYLLDGDFESSISASRDRKYGTADSMAFYTKIDSLKSSFNNRKIKYNFVDANNIQLPLDLKFDLVYSNVSCGYHYPLTTYLELLKMHTTENSVLIFDINSSRLEEQTKNIFNVIETKALPGQKKILKCRLQIIKDRML
jgi:SAM-dependent methyltransferase